MYGAPNAKILNDRGRTKASGSAASCLSGNFPTSERPLNSTPGIHSGASIETTGLIGCDFVLSVAAYSGDAFPQVAWGQG